MKLYLPYRGKKLLSFPLFCKVTRHERPRINKHTNTIYQPVDQVLRQEMANYAGYNFSGPVFVDCYIQFEPTGKEKPGDFAMSKKHGDKDNLDKQLFDAMKAVNILKDDCLIVGGQTLKGIGLENFCIVAIWEAHTEEMRFDVV